MTDDIPPFYKIYYERDVVSLTVALLLWLNIDPDQFKDNNQFQNYLQDNDLTKEAVELTRKIQDGVNHTKELEMIPMALNFAHVIDHYRAKQHVVPGVKLLKFIEWTATKNHKHLFPQKLAAMIRDYNNVPNLSAKIESLETELVEKDSKLTEANNKIAELQEKPNTQAFNTCKALNMGLLAFIFGKTRIITLGQTLKKNVGTGKGNKAKEEPESESVVYILNLLNNYEQQEIKESTNDESRTIIYQKKDERKKDTLIKIDALKRVIKENFSFLL